MMPPEWQASTSTSRSDLVVDHRLVPPVSSPQAQRAVPAAGRARIRYAPAVARVAEYQKVLGAAARADVANGGRELVVAREHW
eukprot:3648857-Prymnesium_polylepis.1